MSRIQRVILVHHTHTDIGYTGVYAQVASQHAGHLRQAVELCTRDRRFRWTVESSWALERFLDVATTAEKEALRACMERGQIEVTAFYAQPLTQFCNLEGLCQTVEPTFDLLREHGLPGRVDTAMINDIGGASYNLPQVLNKAGVRYLVNGCGGWRVMLPFTTLPHLFELEGPDGSAIKYYHLRGQTRRDPIDTGAAEYGFGVVYFLWPMLKHIDKVATQPGDDGEKPILQLAGREGMDLLLQRLEAEGYGYDTLLLQVATDNAGPSTRLLEAIDVWNREFCRPEVVLGTCHDFFAHIEKTGQAVPRVRGEITCSWTEHVLTHADATGRYRRAWRHLRTAGALQMLHDAVAGGPAALGHSDWSQVARELTLYNDHTFGLSSWGWQKRVAAVGSLWDPSLDLPRQSWEIKERYARQAEAQAARLCDEQRWRWSQGDIDTPQSLTIVNTHAHTVSGTVRFYSVEPAVAVRDTLGRELPVQSQAVNTKWFVHTFWMTNVPPFSPVSVSVRTVTDADSAAVGPTYRAEEWRLTGPFGAVTLNPQTGAVESILDGRAGRQWVDAANGHLNELHYFRVSGVAPTLYRGGLDEEVSFRRILPASTVRLQGGSGPVFAFINVRRSFGADAGHMIVDTHYRLDSSGLHIRNHVRKIHEPSSEAMFIGFPLKMDRDCAIDVQQQGQHTRFPAERLLGSTTHSLAAQDFVRVHDAGGQAILAIDQAAVIQLGRIGYYSYNLEYQRIGSPIIYSALFNNLWNTNCPLLQRGELDFDYHFTVCSQNDSPIEAWQWSRFVLEPLSVFPGNGFCPGRGGGDRPVVSIDNEAICLESISPRSPGVWRLRLVETTRQAVTCRLRWSIPRKFSWRDEDDPAAAWNTAEDVELSFAAAEYKNVLLKLNES